MSALVTVFLDARRRAYELTMLRVAAVDGRTLRRAQLLEQLAALLPGLVLGLATGLVATVLVLGSIPEFVSSRGEPPLQLGLPFLPFAMLAAALTISVLLAAALGAWGIFRMARYSVIRMEVS